MDEPERLEKSALPEGTQTHAPEPLRDELFAVTTARPAGRRQLGAGDPRQALVGDSFLGFGEQGRASEQGLVACLARNNRKFFGPAVSGATRMKPVVGGGIAFAVGAFQGLAESEHAFFDRGTTGAATSTPGGCELQDVDPLWGGGFHGD